MYSFAYKSVGECLRCMHVCDTCLSCVNNHLINPTLSTHTRSYSYPGRSAHYPASSHWYTQDLQVLSHYSSDAVIIYPFKRYPCFSGVMCMSRGGLLQFAPKFEIVKLLLIYYTRMTIMHISFGIAFEHLQRLRPELQNRWLLMSIIYTMTYSHLLSCCNSY